MNRRTWAPTGETPVQRAWDRYDRLSVIGAVALSPQRRQVTTPFQIHDDNIRTDEVIGFLTQLRNQLQRPMIVCWDRWSVHRVPPAGSKLRASRASTSSSYLPELNPIEARWSHVKFGKLANFVLDDVAHLKRKARSTLKKQTEHTLKQSFFKTAKLKL